MNERELEQVYLVRFTRSFSGGSCSRWRGIELDALIGCKSRHACLGEEKKEKREKKGTPEFSHQPAFRIFRKNARARLDLSAPWSGVQSSSMEFSGAERLAGVGKSSREKLLIFTLLL